MASPPPVPVLGRNVGPAGPAVLVSLAVAGVGAVRNGLASASIAMVHPRSGGTYEYAGRRMSPAAGFLARSLQSAVSPRCSGSAPSRRWSMTA